MEDSAGKAASSRERFEVLYRSYAGRVLAYALRRTAPEAAHDVVADTFLVAWRRLPGVPDEPLPWLLAVARRTLANQRRSAQRQDALRAELRAEIRVPGETPPGGLARLQAVAGAFARLPERDRELLRLVVWDGLSTRAAATVLSISPVNCRVRLHRARRRLAELAEAEELGPARPTARSRLTEEAK